MLLNYARTSEYKEIIESYLNGLEQIRNFQKWSTIESKVDEVMKKLESDLKKHYREYTQKVITDNEKRMNEIEKEYKNIRTTIPDPQLEILRRQDFDLKISMMSKDEIIEMLKDYSKDFSDYELLKIKSLYPESVMIASLLNEQQVLKDENFLKDSNYVELLDDVTVLRSVSNMGLSMVYIPNDAGLEFDGNIKQYTTLDISLVGRRFSPTGILNEIEKVKALIKGIKIQTVNTEDSEIRKFSKSNQAKPYKYPEFDERIFRGTNQFDVTVRFKYLQERFDDTTTNRWDPYRNGYDPVAHFKFLEGRHERKMEEDSTYAEEYRQAEIKAKIGLIRDEEE